MKEIAPAEVKEHPIEQIMDSAFGKMRSITDADIIVGEPITLPDGTNVVPVNKVSIGIVSGGGEYGTHSYADFPFAGASGAGMSMSPVCFLVSDGKSVRVIGTEGKTALDKVMDAVPDTVSSLLGGIFGGKKRK